MQKQKMHVSDGKKPILIYSISRIYIQVNHFCKATYILLIKK